MERNSCDDLDDRFRKLERRVYYKDQLVFREGATAADVYIIQTGRIEIFKKRDGSETSLAILGPNAIFGEMALVSDKRRSASARALTETVCHVIQEADFRARLDESGRFSDALIRVLAENVRSTSELLTSREADLVARERELQQREVILDEQARLLALKEKQIEEAAEEYDRLMRELLNSIDATARPDPAAAVGELGAAAQRDVRRRRAMDAA
ncbi:MAG: cyclic nucleotide-binding domain-containing protein [Acetobacterales bacterium]